MAAVAWRLSHSARRRPWGSREELGSSDPGLTFGAQIQVLLTFGRVSDRVLAEIVVLHVPVRVRVWHVVIVAPGHWHGCLGSVRIGHDLRMEGG